MPLYCCLLQRRRSPASEARKRAAPADRRGGRNAVRRAGTDGNPARPAPQGPGVAAWIAAKPLHLCDHEGSASESQRPPRHSPETQRAAGAAGRSESEEDMPEDDPYVEVELTNRDREQTRCSPRRLDRARSCRSAMGSAWLQFCRYLPSLERCCAEPSGTPGSDFRVAMPAPRGNVIQRAPANSELAQPSTKRCGATRRRCLAKELG